MQIKCPTCDAGLNLSDEAAGALVRCRACGKSFVAPRELAVVGQAHRLTPFSVTGLLLLHFVSLGLFSIVYLNLMHDRLPRLRRSDPTGLTAVGLCFVPGINLVWFFFTFRRLCLRINEQRRFRGLDENAPQTLALMVCTLLACGFAGTILPLTGWVVLGATLSVLIPVFLATLQASVNELVASDDMKTAEQARLSADTREEHGRPDPSEPSVSRHGDLGEGRERCAVEGPAGP